MSLQLFEVGEHCGGEWILLLKFAFLNCFGILRQA